MSSGAHRAGGKSIACSSPAAIAWDQGFRCRSGRSRYGRRSPSHFAR
jgi:hypothetical protein